MPSISMAVMKDKRMSHMKTISTARPKTSMTLRPLGLSSRKAIL